ncbi:MAG: heavy-metal-associated domain-containing protein [Polaromonas sp.]
MKTSSIEVHDMLSVFGVEEVEKRIGEVPGVKSVTVNFAAGSATVRYDETRLESADIKSAVRQRGYESTSPADASIGERHEGHAARNAPPAPAAPMNAPIAPATADAEPQVKAAPSATSNTSPAEPAVSPAASEGDARKDKAVPDKS